MRLQVAQRLPLFHIEHSLPFRTPPDLVQLPLSSSNCEYVVYQVQLLLRDGRPQPKRRGLVHYRLKCVKWVKDDRELVFSD